MDHYSNYSSSHNHERGNWVNGSLVSQGCHFPLPGLFEKEYWFHMSKRLNLLHPRKDVAEMVIVFRVSLIVPKDLTFVTKSAKHVYQKSSFFVSPLSFLRVS